MKQSVTTESERKQNTSTQHKPIGAFLQRQDFADNRRSTHQLQHMAAVMNHSPLAIAQRKLSEQSHGSARMIAQRQQRDKLTGAVTQRVDGKEELMQGKFQPVQRVEDEELVQGKFETSQRVGDEELVQGKFAATQLTEAPTAKQNNTGLPDNLKSGIEQLSGLSMDHVKVHYNSSQPAQLNALAYAQGTDIHVAPGQEQHLPHEAWHVVQQAQGRVKPTMQMAGQRVNDDQGLEREADVMGERARSIHASVGIVQQHSKQCGCASCTSTIQNMTVQKNKNAHGGTVFQLMKCPECGKDKGHLSGCSRHKHNRSNTGKGTHKLGGSHDDGSGYQRSGAGGDRHEKGRRAAQKAKERKEKKKKNR